MGNAEFKEQSIEIDLVPYDIFVRTKSSSTLIIENAFSSVLGKMNNDSDVTGNRFSGEHSSSYHIDSNGYLVYMDFDFVETGIDEDGKKMGNIEIKFTPKLKAREMVDNMVGWINENYDAMQEIGYEALNKESITEKIVEDRGYKTREDSEDGFRNYLMKKVDPNSPLITFGTELTYEQNKQIAEKSMELLSAKDENFIQVIDNAIEEGKGIYVMKNSDETGLQSLFYGKGEQYDKYTSGDWVILTEESVFPLLFENERLKFVDKQWTEITEENWWHAFEELPPFKNEHIDESIFFYCAEALTGSIHSCYAKVDDKYYTATKDIYGKEGYADFIGEIRGQRDSGTLKKTLDDDSIVDEVRAKNAKKREENKDGGKNSSRFSKEHTKGYRS